MFRGVAKASGSSPRVRGTRSEEQGPPRPHRIIPACAGNTRCARRCSGARWDHPRACGEHPSRIFVEFTVLGSSPRVRGTRLVVAPAQMDRGIIPACAGNTRPPCRRASRCRDHPRVCGEHLHAYGYTPFLTGSSPRVRGTRRDSKVHNEGRGIIPACAGNTDFLVGRKPQARDHPRVCGEHRSWTALRAWHMGSSPRVRGTLDRVDVLIGQLGIIPACAGNTQSPKVRRPHGRDHPRVCGEHSFEVLFMSVCAGSSPRVRGTLGPL